MEKLKLKKKKKKKKLLIKQNNINFWNTTIIKKNKAQIQIH